MTVKELIQQLQTYDPETLVVTEGYEGGFDDPHVTTVHIITNTNVDSKGQKVEWWQGRHSVADTDDEAGITAVLI